MYHVLESAIKNFHVETEVILVQYLDVIHQILRLRDGKKSPDDNIASLYRED